MPNRIAKIAILLFIPLAVVAAPKEKGSTTIQVVTARTKIHGTSSGNIFTYTDLMFTQVNGKNVVYECVQSGDICPVLESGKDYTADVNGIFLYLPMTSPESKKAGSAKFKKVGSW
jgi:hypothetical protein